jgi:hypothetical protein
MNPDRIALIVAEITITITFWIEWDEKGLPT